MDILRYIYASDDCVVFDSTGGKSMQKKLLRMTCTFSGHSIGTKSGQRAENWDILASQVTCVFLGTSPQKPGCPGKSGMIGQFQFLNLPIMAADNLRNIPPHLHV